MGIKDFWQAGQVALSANRLADRALYKQIAEEMRQGIRDEALWLMAYEKASGDDKATQANYIGLRVQALKDEAVIMGAVADAQKPVEAPKAEATPPPPVSQNYPEKGVEIALTVIALLTICITLAFILAWATNYR